MSPLWALLITLLFCSQACAEENFSSKNYKLEELNEQIKKNPGQVKWYLIRADYGLRTHGTTPAMEDYQRVLKIEPNNTLALRNLGKLYLINARWNKAEPIYELLVKLKPTAENFADLGEAKLMMKNYSGLAGSWIKCQQLAPDVVPQLERGGFAHFILGDWSTGAKNFEEAFRSTKEATPWPIADACLAALGYDLAHHPSDRARVLKDAAQKESSELDLFDLITLKYMQGKITAQEYLKSREDPYYINQARFFIGFELFAQGKTSEGLGYLRQCEISAWTPHDDQKRPLEAVLSCFLQRSGARSAKQPSQTK